MKLFKIYLLKRLLLSSLHNISYVVFDCGESFKAEDIKEEVKDDESIDDTLTIHQKIANSNVVGEDIKKGNLIMHMLKKHTKFFSCSVCHKSFAKNSKLFKHNKSASHLERMKSINTNIPLTQSSFVDWDESIKEEVKEEENVDAPSSISYSTENYIKEEIKEEVNEFDEGQGVDHSNLDTDNLVDCSEYVQVQMNLTK